MAKATTQATAPAAAGLKKISGIKVTVEGQMALSGDRKTDIKKYEEFFFLKAEHRKQALFLVRRFLVEHRLEKNHDNFKFVRTCGVKSITITEDIGISALRKKGLDNLDSEEVRAYAILMGYPLDIVQDIPVAFDCLERIHQYEKDPKKWGKKNAPKSPDDTTPDGEVGGNGLTATKESWEDLDND